jgi:hypothetical protein
MGSRFVRPDTDTLTLANGDTLTVKRRLTHGERAAAMARITALQSGAGMALVTAYLLDWHLAEDDVPIRGVPVDELASVLDTLSPEDFAEILDAIETHIAAKTAERTAEKNETAGETTPAATSPSPSAAVGVLTGSEP